MLDETEYASAVITEADKGTVAILSTLDMLDRQVEEVSKEITAYVIFAHQFMRRAANQPLIPPQSANESGASLEPQAEQCCTILSAIKETAGIRSGQTSRSGGAAAVGTSRY